MSTIDTVPQQQPGDRPQRPESPPPVSRSYDRPGSVIDEVSGVIFGETPLWWWAGFIPASLLMLVFIFTLGSIAIRGTGLWGIDIPAVWGMGITNLVFWIGIGHAGTFISAFLLLMRQHWRGAFSRFAEAMTLFALAIAGLFPIFHVGRPEFVFYTLPYPNTFVLNPQWRSPLVWDLVAISTYGLISLLFWYIDLIPDLAAMRDKAKKSWVKSAYGTFAMGWRGESAHWSTLHRTTYMLAALATPLVISVHSIVGFDFSIAITPGWHHTIFPPFFVGGAIFSGLAMVIIFAAILRSGMGLKNLIRDDHMDKAAQLMLVTGLVVTYGYFVENFGLWFSQDTHEQAVAAGRFTGAYSPAYWLMILMNVVVIQALWFKRVRRNITLLVAIAICVLIGMWLERFIIIPASLAFPYMESAWDIFAMNGWDILTLISPFGMFFTLMFLFIRFVPMVPVSEIQQHATEDHGEEEEE